MILDIEHQTTSCLRPAQALDWSPWHYYHGIFQAIIAQEHDPSGVRFNFHHATRQISAIDRRKITLRLFHLAHLDCR
jgi:hypothetical protein